MAKPRPADPRQTSMDFVAAAKRAAVTRSTEQAMEVLESTRGDLVVAARDVALRLATLNGTVTSREVRREMAAVGKLNGVEGDYWLGAVFRDSRFEWTGRYTTYSDSARNIHERTIKIWKLKGTTP